ncbi:MAG: EAL domain-containing protein [Arthrobacter sp.]
MNRSLLDGLTTDRQRETLVAAILQLIHSAGLGAVAKGIEDSEQADRLRQLDCEFGQGYFFSRPLSVRDMTDLPTRRDGAAA